MITITESEANAIMAILYRIRTDAYKLDRKKHTIANLCDKISATLKRAQRRRKQSKVLRFEQSDIES